MQPVGEGGRGGFIEQALDLESGELPGDARCLALRVAEVGRNGDHRFDHALPERGFRIGLQRAQHEARQLLGPKFASAQLHRALGAHRALEHGRRKVRVREQTFTRGQADDHLIVIVQAHHRGCQDVSQRIGQEFAAAVTPYRDQTVRRAQVDADDHGPGV